jgi:predicted O-methyltransferase YrrM
MWDDGSVECEVGELLYGLVRVIKPNNILETGIYHGWSTAYLAAGVLENKIGHIDTVEFEKQHIDEAWALWARLEVNSCIDAHLESSLDFTTDKQYELVLLDTEPQLRYLELERFWNNIVPGGIIVIHDLSWDLGSGAPQFWLHKEIIDQKIKDHELQVINFLTPRGITILQKFDPTYESFKLHTK